MILPGSAPSTPPSHEPSLLVFTPSYAVVSSPMYQSVPVSSCAYQSYVSSTIMPPERAVSRTTMQVTPMMTLVSLVTDTVTISPVSSTLYSNTVPGTSGKYWLFTPETKCTGSILGS